jgi:hypothetical protein
MKPFLRSPAELRNESLTQTYFQDTDLGKGCLPPDMQKNEAQEDIRVQVSIKQYIKTDAKAF